MTQDEIIEMATQVSERNYGRIIFFEFEVEELEAFAKLVAAKAIAELESQELKQVTVKDFVHMVEGKEDLIGRPVCFAQWPNGNTSSPQRTEQEPMEDDFFKMIADRNPKPFPPPQRTWVGLTDEEVNEIYISVEEKVNEHWESGGTTMMFPLTLYKAIEQALREKKI